MATIILFVVGLGLLILGAESLVRGASRLAAMIGVSPLIIGLTFVAFGTSSPELAVSINSALLVRSDIALGNIIGSNIFNILFILGLSALISPLIISQQLIKLDVPIMIAISILTLLFAGDGKITRIEGGILFIGFLAYTTLLFFLSRKEVEAVREEYFKEYGTHTKATRKGWIIHCFFVLMGLLLLILGSRWFVEGSVAIARVIGVSELVIGLTIVAAGTSLPEVATSIVASIRGERDIAVGNLVGSNIFNLLSVLGLSTLVAPGGIGVPDSALHFDIPVMIAVAVACLPIFFTGNIIARWEGVLFFGYYVAYTAYIILASKGHELLPLFSVAMLAFVLPITFVTLITIAVRALLVNRKKLV